MEMDDILENTDRYTNQLQDENKFNRRNTINKILQEVEKCSTEPSIEKLQEFVRPLMSTITDPVETSRENSYKLLAYIFRQSTASTILDYLPILVPTLVHRLGQCELNEPSEEVRLIAVELIEVIVEKVGTQLCRYVDDLLHILSNTLVDPFHSVRLLSCKVTCNLASETRTVFHYNSERLLKPLCVSITHQQHRVRQATVECIGQVILLGSHKSVEQVIPHITQRLFDPNGNVRKAVLTVISAWMREFVDRYSYFHKFLPIILTGLCDESAEIAEYADAQWRLVGQKWLDETGEEYKDQIDFENIQLKHYPPNVKRPSLGCRLLTWQNAIKILPGISSEIGDWVVSTRVKSAQLLYNIILNCEDKITMHTEKILSFIYRATLDTEMGVVNYIHKSAELLGYFVPLTITWPILSSAIKFGSTEGNLAVLASVLKGSEPQAVESLLEEIVKLISDPDICQTLKPKKQLQLLEICKVLLEMAPYAASSQSSLTFKIIITVLGLTEEITIQNRSKELLSSLQKVCCMESLDELMGKECGPVLLAMKQSSSEWTPVSPDKLIFEVILSHGGSAVDANMGTIVDLLISNLSPEKDPEVRLKFFTMLGRHLLNYNQTCTTRKKELQLFLKQIIEEVLDPNLVWRAGQTAGALRTAASSCLLAILQGNVMECDVLLQVAPKIVASMMGLLEESTEVQRLIVCQTLQKVIVSCERKLSPDLLNRIYPGMLKRMDDVSNDVRVAACYTIAKVFTNLPAEYNLDFYKANIIHAYSTLLIHLDDVEEGIQDVVLDVLTQIGPLRPNDLMAECMKIKNKHRNTKRCDNLLSKMQEYASGNKVN